jgi:hypothetical protein
LKEVVFRSHWVFSDRVAGEIEEKEAFFIDDKGELIQGRNEVEFDRKSFEERELFDSVKLSDGVVVKI